MVHKEIKIERSLKNKVAYKGPFSSSKLVTSTFNSSTFKNDDVPKVAFKEGSKGMEVTKEKGKVEVTSSRARDIQCYKYKGHGYYSNNRPTKKTMAIRANAEIIS